jgi:hypothetical protein
VLIDRLASPATLGGVAQALVTAAKTLEAVTNLPTKTFTTNGVDVAKFSILVKYPFAYA